MERDRVTVAGNDVPRVGQPGHLDLEAFHGGIDIADRSAGAGFFPEHVPWFEGLAELEADAAPDHRASGGKSKFKMGREPLHLQREPRFSQVADYIRKILRDKMREHKPVVDFRAPPDEAMPVGLLPEPGHERAQEQLLGEAHPLMRRHLERAELDEPQAAACAVRRVEFVDAKFGAMGVAGNVHEQVAKEAVDEPRWTGAGFGNLPECDFEFVQRIIPGFVKAGMLAGRADEQAGK